MPSSSNKSSRRSRAPPTQFIDHAFKEIKILKKENQQLRKELQSLQEEIDTKEDIERVDSIESSLGQIFEEQYTMKEDIELIKKVMKEKLSINWRRWEIVS